MSNATITLRNTPRREAPRFYAERIANIGTVYHAPLSRSVWRLFHRLNRISRWEGARFIRDVEPNARRTLYYAMSCMDAVDWLAVRENSRAKGFSARSAFIYTH